MIEVPLGAVLELILIDKGKTLEAPVEIYKALLELITKFVFALQLIHIGGRTMKQSELSGSHHSPNLISS